MKLYDERDDFNFHSVNFPFMPFVVIVTQIYHNGQPSHGGDRNIFEVMISPLPTGTLVSVASVLTVSSIPKS
jgi:hypothetical protein